MLFRARAVATSAALIVPLLVPAAVAAADDDRARTMAGEPIAEAEEGVGSENMEFVANLQFPDEVEGGSYKATDLDFHSYPVDGEEAGDDERVLPPRASDRVPAHAHDRVRSGPGGGGPSDGGETRDFAFVGTALNGLQVVDISDRENPELVATYDCRVSQSDVFVFEQGDRVLAAYSLDAVAQNEPEGSACHEDNGVTDPDARGTFLIDVTDPYAPQSVSFLPMRKGTHQVTVHPDGDYLYNSAAVVVTTELGTIEVYDIGVDATPEEPLLVDEIELGVGLDSHDMTFNADGSRLYSAALTQSLVIDTTDPTSNEIVTQIYDPSINIHHDAHAVTVDTVYGEREFMFIGDELAGAVGTGTCPGGGVHVYDITGDLEQFPVKVGAFFIPEVRATGGLDTCTAHVLDVQEDEQLISIAWYNAGVRVLDYSGLAELGPQGLSIGISPTLGGSLTPGITEIGHFRFPDSSLWSAKVPEVEDDGSFYIYGGDIDRALDVFRFDAAAPRQADGGDWVDPQAALARAPITGTAFADDRAGLGVTCLLPGT
jgi:hypothetical protein